MENMNYTLGRGELYFNKFKPGTQVGIGERYFGNTPSLSANVQSDNLDHYNSDRGVKEKDASVVLQTNRTGSFVTDHISPENLALFFFGSVNALTVAAATNLAVAFDKVKVGYFYQLGESMANPTGDRNITNLKLTDDKTPTPTPLVAGTDYMLNPELGRVEILGGGAIVDGTTNLRGTYDITASTREIIISGSQPVEGSLKYIAQNPVGDKIDYFWPWVKLTPNGDFALKGDEWQQIPFNIEILKRTGYEAVYATKRPAASA
ncbi:hypothetical protein AH2_00057 [Burkholderia phage vB_BceS_AH2]|uniref:Uncharacterized protein n=1 Tax=Burkholderia phage vB_BceS_AH2 TaxID=1133022 RepID=I6NSG8_9CAUD|nr:major tail protein with Ig-like domain [Burkholderia phage vB_BceS_AH2]AEY69567.1 hypothetical protein AH2_00057 [Burkholderia phage vB_BceS_AH2]